MVHSCTVWGQVGPCRLCEEIHMYICFVKKVWEEVDSRSMCLSRDSGGHGCSKIFVLSVCRGAVPPGARFDPIGPPDPDGGLPNPQGRYRGEPDPDHEPPPGFDDMYM